MGGVVGTLFVLWVRSGFSTQKVAAALTFFPPESTYELAEQDGRLKRKITVPECDAPEEDMSILQLQTSKKTIIPGFFYKHPQAHYTIIFSHGNATDCGAMHRKFLEMRRKLGANIFAYDYSGYGTATGEPSEKHTYADIQAAYDHVASNFCNNPSEEIILYGQSIGSGPSIFLASKNQVAGLIVHSGITSGMRVLTESRTLGCLDIYPNIDRIVKVSCPTLIIHGREDEEVPFNHGLSLFNALPSKSKVEPLWVPGRGHNDIGETYECRSLYYEKIGGFLAGLDIKYKK